MIMTYTICVILNMVLIGFFFKQRESYPTQDEIDISAIVVLLGPIAYIILIVFSIALWITMLNEDLKR